MQSYRHADRHADRQTDRQTDIQTYRQTYYTGLFIDVDSAEQRTSELWVEIETQ